MNGWHYVKHLLAIAHCGHDLRCYKDDIENRQMVIAFMKDYNGIYSTIFISLEGSPPKAYAILRVCSGDEFKLIKENGELKVFSSWTGKSGDKICVNAIKILDSALLHYKTVKEEDMSKPVVKLSLKELLSRKDAIIMNAEAI
jgi:formate-dependent nitrite reductase cytochrome c552 subunit